MTKNKASGGGPSAAWCPDDSRMGRMIPDAWFAPYVRASAHETCAPCFFLVRCVLVYFESVRVVARVR